MSKLTKAEQRVLDAAREMGTPFAPTELGMRMGFEQTRASSRVAPQLRSLTAAGVLVKQGSGRHVTYEVRG